MAATISYVDWTSATAGYPGSAGGTMLGGTVNVSYSGEVEFAQTSGGSYYWTEGSPAPYTGNAVIGNTPDTSDIIALTGQGQILNTLTFDKPVANPVMLLISLGQPNLPVIYAFNQSFTFLSSGVGYYGGSSGALYQSGNAVIGYEGHGAIQFNGTFNSISWYAIGDENWHGFTVGAASATVPDVMSTFGALLCGLTSLGFIRRLKK